MKDEEISILWQEFVQLLKSTNRQNIDYLIQWLDTSDFKTAPASSKYHGSFKGGLLKHSLNVYNCMQDFSNLITFFEIPQESIIITSLLHDICKVDCYTETTRNVKVDGEWTTVPYYEWNEKEPFGHAEKSIIKIYECGVPLSKIEIAMIRNHMGFTTCDDDRRVSKLFRICPQSLILHWADEMATFVLEGYDIPQKFIDKLSGKNITESLQLGSKPKTINILGTEYTLAPENAVVDNETVIEMNYEGNMIKIYAPHGDGLPF